jgi:hypothetical protein
VRKRDCFYCRHFLGTALSSIILDGPQFCAVVFFLAGYFGMMIGMNFSKIAGTISRNWLTFAFIGGFITDLLLLNRIDDIVDNLILLTYVVLATVSLLMFYAGVAERFPYRVSRVVQKYAPIVLQYSFGGLLSGMLIFYGRSGDWLASAPFFILILVVIIGNELLEKRSDRLLYYIALYFIGIFSYVVLVLPVLLGRMGDGIFILSGLLALLFVSGVIRMLYSIVPNFMQSNTRRVILMLSTLYISLTALYFFNLIPPIPLSLTELDIVQSVVRDSNGDYRIVDEEQPWYRQIPLVRNELHPTGRSIACFARVYAPTRLETRIYHRWEFKDAAGDWQEAFRFGYPITGENRGGYRGFTRLESFRDGIWRCGVENERGQVLGRTIVRINTTDPARAMVTRIE